MNPIFTSAAAAGLRAMRRHQGLPTGRRVPMWRLLLGEAAYAVGLLAVPRRGLPAVAAGVAVLVGLSAATPGPVAPLPLRAVLAAFVAGLGAFAGARFLTPARRGNQGPTDQPLPARAAAAARDAPLNQAVVGIGMVVLFAAILVAVGWSLALVMSALF